MTATPAPRVPHDAPALHGALARKAPAGAAVTTRHIGGGLPLPGGQARLAAAPATLHAAVQRAPGFGPPILVHGDAGA